MSLGVSDSGFVIFSPRCATPYSRPRSDVDASFGR